MLLVITQLLNSFSQQYPFSLTSRFCLRAISQLLIPMSTKTIEAAKSAFREKVGKETKEESIGRRSSEHIVKNNAMQQIAALLSFKEAFAKGIGAFVSFASCCLHSYNLVTY